MTISNDMGRPAFPSGEQQKLPVRKNELMWKVFASYKRMRTSPIGEAFEIVAVSLLLAALIRVAAFQAFYIPSRSMMETLQPFDHILSNKITYRLRDPERGEIVVFRFGEGKTPPPLSAQPVHGKTALDSARSEMEPERDYVKRVIAVAGDELEIDKSGIYVNGKLTEILETGAPDLSSAPFAFLISGRTLRFVGREPLIDGKHLRELLPENLPYAAIQDRSPSNFGRFGSSGICIYRMKVPQGMLFVMGDNTAESIDSRFFGFLRVNDVKGRAIFTYWPFSRLRFL